MNKNIKSISDKHSFCLFPGSFWFNVIPRGFFTIAWFLYGIIFQAQAALSNIPWKVIVLPFSAAVSAQINVMWFLSQTRKYISISQFYYSRTYKTIQGSMLQSNAITNSILKTGASPSIQIGLRSRTTISNNNNTTQNTTNL